MYTLPSLLCISDPFVGCCILVCSLCLSFKCQDFLGCLMPASYIFFPFIAAFTALNVAAILNPACSQLCKSFCLLFPLSFLHFIYNHIDAL